MILIAAIAALLVTLIVWEIASDTHWKQGLASQIEVSVKESNFQVFESQRSGVKTRPFDLA